MSRIHLARSIDRPRLGRAVLAAWFSGLVLVACGGKRSPEAAPPQSPDSLERQEGAPAEPADAFSTEEEAGAYDEGAEAGPPPPQAPAGAAPASEMPGTTRATSVERDADDIEALLQDLDRALTLSTPDCTTGASLRDRICSLSDRICRLADRNPGEGEIAEHCRDARARCRRARDRVGQSCP